MKHEKVVIYARQSSGCDDQSESIDFQIQQCQELAHSNNMVIIGVFADYNTSGRLYPTGAENVAEQDKALLKWQQERTFDKRYRPELGKALTMLSLADYLMVYDSTRLCRPVRNSFLQQYLDNALIESNVKLMITTTRLSTTRRTDTNSVRTLRSSTTSDCTARDWWA